MTLFRIALTAASVLGLIGGTVETSDATTNFNGSTIIDIDQAQHTVTFRTKEGEKWTLPVVNPELIKPERIAQGDQVSIEIDLDDRITKILKPSDSPGAGQQAAREDGAQ